MRPSLRRTLAVLPLAAACAAFGASAQAQSIINFEGKVNDSGCSPELAGGGNAVKLTDIDIGDFQGINQPAPAGDTNFTINFTGCTPSGGISTAKVYFYSTDPNAVTSGRLNKQSGTGSGWQYQLTPATTFTQLNVGDSASWSNAAHDPGGNITPGNGSATYRVRYFQNAASISPGTTEATVSYVLYYQ